MHSIRIRNGMRAWCVSASEVCRHTRGVCRFFAFGRKIGGKHERIPVQFLSRRAAGRRADAQILAAVHPVAARRRAVQHRRPALHRQRELPRLLRQRGQQRRVPADGHRARHRHHDRRRLPMSASASARGSRSRRTAASATPSCSRSSSALCSRRCTSFS